MQKVKAVRKLVAIGGGEIGRPGTAVETAKIDREIIRLSGKKHPRLLFVPTASSDAAGYVEAVEKHFGRDLGCEVDALLLLREKPSMRFIRKKIEQADIVYVGGGNTLLMMKAWRRRGVDELLRKAYERGAVLAGLSAGSICWFSEGLSDAKMFKDKRAGYSKVRGLGLIKALHCPHYDAEKARPAALEEMMQKTAGVAIALENCAALEVVGDRFRLLASREGARGYKIFYERGVFRKQAIAESAEYGDLADLTQKRKPREK